MSAFPMATVPSRLSPALPGLHGASAALLTPALMVFGLLACAMTYNVAVHGISAVMSEIASEFSGDSLRDTLADEESAGLFFLLAACAVYLPFTILAAYLGGKLGGRSVRASARPIN